MLLPATREEMKRRGWSELDVVLVTGDAFIDSPYIGIAVIARVLFEAGYRVGIIAQPDIHSEKDISRLGEPRLFWGVTGGSIDSMVANYTAAGKRRKTDDYTPGGKNLRRPDRALIVYSQLIRRYFKDRRPIILGGIEASLRRISHYDFWSDRVRRSVLFDAKADYLLYGMAEATVLAFAERISEGKDPRDLRGLCYISKEASKGFIELPSHDRAATDTRAFIEMFRAFYDETDPITACGLVQRQDTRYLVQNPPHTLHEQNDLDKIHDMAFTHMLHPFDERLGNVRALETVRSSIITHRGCYGECHFCAIGVHQGRTVQWRSEKSILQEIERLRRFPDFKGIIQDLGGPTANMYGFECEKKLKSGICRHRRCMFPDICSLLPVTHLPQISLFDKIRNMDGVRKVFVRSGVRYDLVLADARHGDAYLKALTAHHVSGQLKVAPEHVDDNILKLMGKQKSDKLIEFKRRFDRYSRESGKRQYLTYYFIAAHPGCDESGMMSIRRFADRHLQMTPEQVQIFTPTPSTYSSLMYYTGVDPFTMEPVFVEKDPVKKERQKRIVTEKRGVAVRKSQNKRGL